MTSNTSKRDDLKRLVIYVLLAYAVSWIPAIILNKTVGYKTWFEESKLPFYAYLVGFGPAIANILTRLITKEGFGNTMIHLRLKNNLKYYILAMVIPTVNVLLSIAATMIAFGGDLSAVSRELSASQLITVLLSGFSSSLLFTFMTFGEEFGWRAYMNQKLESLTGTTGAVIIGGILWGLWHAELTVEGHNFGTDYPGFPYVGMILMCFFCISLGIPMMWLTKKTGSVLPAAILHAFNNYFGSIIRIIFAEALPKDVEMNFGNYMIQFIPQIVICAVVFVIMIVGEKKKKVSE